MNTPKKSRSGTSRTEAQLLAVGWAQKLQIRLRQDEATALDSVLLDGETRQAGVRRIVANFVRKQANGNKRTNQNPRQPRGLGGL